MHTILFRAQPKIIQHDTTRKKMKKRSKKKYFFSDILNHQTNKKNTKYDEENHIKNII